LFKNSFESNKLLIGQMLEAGLVNVPMHLFLLRNIAEPIDHELASLAGGRSLSRSVALNSV